MTEYTDNLIVMKPRPAEPPHCDVERILRALEESRREREAFVPGVITIVLDNEPYQDIVWEKNKFSTRLKAGSNILRLVGYKDDGKEINLATHVLMYDDAPQEPYVAKISNYGQIYCLFKYFKNEVVRMDLRLVEEKQPVVVMPTFGQSSGELVSRKRGGQAANPKRQSRQRPQPEHRP